MSGDILHAACCLAVAALSLLPGGGFAEDSTGAAMSIDRLERQLEMGRHEQFMEVKGLASSRLTEFTTDGCSGGLSVGWEYLATKIESFQDRHGVEPPWQDCCVAHDRAYHTGGEKVTSSRDSFTRRKEADLALQECVRRTGESRRQDLAREYGLSGEDVARLYGVIARLMYRAVRIGGMPCTGLPWRWGYGWPECGEE